VGKWGDGEMVSGEVGRWGDGEWGSGENAV